MNKEMIISSTSHETRVAILEDDQVVEIFIEREQSRGVVGNIYKGRVSKVLPGMQSAFVDLDLDRDAFLYVSDVISPTEEALEDEEEDLHAEVAPVDAPAGTATARPLRKRTRMAAARIVRATRRPAAGEESVRAGSRRDRDRQPPSARIEDLLKKDRVWSRWEGAAKMGGARITSTLPSWPVPRLHADRRPHRRLPEDRVVDERRRLRGIIQRFREQSGRPA
jgi:ribonuclease G